MMSWMVAETKKYSWARRSSRPARPLSLGYSTRQMFSDRARASIAPM